MNSELSKEEQKLLTEFLGRKWHDIPADDVCKTCGAGRLTGCNPDFFDWRVIGRLVEKLPETQHFYLGLERVDTRTWRSHLSVDSKAFAKTPQSTICLAIVKLLKEGER